jgi:hypothetical protein
MRAVPRHGSCPMGGVRHTLLIIGLVGCISTAGDVALDGCPPHEVCSPNAPEGLHFFDHGLPTAVGGTQTLTLMRRGEDGLEPLDVPYHAEAIGTAFEVEGTDGPEVTLRAISLGSDKLEIRDGYDESLMDRKTFDSDVVESIVIVSPNPEETELPVAFLAGRMRFAIALSGIGRMVDESMTIELAGATRVRWDAVELADATAGIHSVAVTAGDHPTESVDFLIVPAVEAIIDQPPLILPALDATGIVCFDALAQGHHVAGLEWTFAVDNGTVGNGLFGITNCAFLTPERAGTVEITARAANLERVLVLQVPDEEARVAPDAPRPVSTAGEIATSYAARGL